MTSRKPGLGKRFLGVCFPETEDEQPLEEEPEACLMHSVHCGSVELCRARRILEQRSERPSAAVGVIRSWVEGCMHAD